MGGLQAAVEECERNLTERAIEKKKRLEENLKWLARFCGQVKGWCGPGEQEIAGRAKALAGVVRLTGQEPKNLQSRPLRLQVGATRPGRLAELARDDPELLDLIIGLLYHFDP